MFDFEPHLVGASHQGWFAQKVITPDEYRDAVFASKKRSGTVGMMANIIENHDEPRGVSRYLPAADIHETSKKMLGGLMMMTYGLPFLYQGQELGMTNTVFEDIGDVDDINTKDEYKVALTNGLSVEEALAAVGRNSRDNARTPMQWSDEVNAGFTTGTPWLKVNPNYKAINADDQLQREDSVFAFYKEMIALRKDERYKECIVYGEQIPAFAEQENLMAFYRKGEHQTLLVIANYQKEERLLGLPEKAKAVVANNYSDVQLEDQRLLLQGYQFLVLEV